MVGKVGKYNCWEVKNPSSDPFKCILEDVKRHLDQAGERVPESRLLGYDIFMIGNSPETAIPHIMFHCSRKEPRKKAALLIKESSLLGSYPGLNVGHWASPPHLSNIQTIQCDGESETEIAFVLEPMPSFPHKLHDGRPVLGDNSGLFRLVVQQRNRTELETATPPVSAYATVSLGVKYDGQVCFVAPAHTFIFEDSASLHCDDDDDFELGGLDEAASSTHEDEPDGEPEHLVNGHAETELSLFSKVFGSIFKDRQDHEISPAFGGCLLVSRRLDYVLLPRPSSLMSPLWQLSRDTVKQIENGETDVFSVNSQGITMPGVLMNRPSYMSLPGAKEFQVLYPVQFDAKLERGDSGAAVVCMSSAKIYGHIVVASTDASMAYIVPAFATLLDIEAHPRPPAASVVGDSSSSVSLRESQPNQESQPIQERQPIHESQLDSGSTAAQYIRSLSGGFSHASTHSDTVGWLEDQLKSLSTTTLAMGTPNSSVKKENADGVKDGKS